MNTTTIIATDTTFSNYIGKDRVLGKYPDALAAYSLREIGTRYVGPIIRVRRSTDSAEKDFYAKSGALDINEVKNFVGTGSGFIATWYDQSGNDMHATQTAADSQPKIISNGVIVLFRSTSCIMFDGVDDALVIPDALATQFRSGDADLSIFSACIPNTNSTAFSVFAMGARTNTTPTNNDTMLFQANAAYGSSGRKSGGVLFRKYTTTTVDVTALGSGPAATNTPLFLGFVRDASAVTINDASTSLTTPNVVVGDLEVSMATIGAVRRGNPGNVEASNPNSKIAELVIYRKSYRSVIADIISDMSSYYI